MKKILLFTVFLCGPILFCSAQTNPDNSKLISADQIKAKKSPASNNDKPEVSPSIDKNINSDSKSKGNESENKSQTRYYEYKVDGGNNTSTSTGNQVEEKPITTPIQAEGYTDPNYEANKKKAEEITKQLNAPATSIIANEELILDLQSKIKAIKDGTNTDPIAINKLPGYEKELELLLSKKQKGSCVTE